MNQRNNIVDSNTLSTLEFHTKLSKEERKRHINWFNKQNIEFQIMIFDEQKNQFFKLRNEYADKKILALASFLLAIKYFYDKEKLLKLKNKSQTLSEFGNISKIERIKLKKEKPKQKLQMLLSIHSVILQLHSDGYSLRDMKQLLQSKYRKYISHTYLSQYINEYILKKDENYV